MKVFGDFDLSDFWSGGDYERDNYRGELLQPESIASVERELGYQLPKSYVDLMSFQNGGTPNNTCHATAEVTLGPTITLRKLGFLRLIGNQRTRCAESLAVNS
ncbi:MAG: SMI1/KNR4 family protein [Paracoccaceae bacterium]